jgi:hypothetical protein
MTTTRRIEMWKPAQHSDDENLQWLCAMEWRHWPLFLSQPIIPVLLYFYSWPWVIGLVVIATFVWWFIVAPQFTPSTVIDLAVYFVSLRFVTSPLMAYEIWQTGRPWIAVLALFWPFVGNGLVLWLLVFPEVALASTARAKAAQIGVIQQRLMSRFGYRRHEAEELRRLTAAGLGNRRSAGGIRGERGAVIGAR